jgi:hypothetical protein
VLLIECDRGAQARSRLLQGFKTLRRPGGIVSPGDRVVVPPLAIEVGALEETVQAAFTGPLPGSLGLESWADYLRSCWSSIIDTAIARNIKLTRGRQIQFRLDMFNQAQITGRNSTVSLTSPLDSTAANLPFDASGNLIATRSQPKNAGFGVANAYAAPRTLQAQIRFSF